MECRQDLRETADCLTAFFRGEDSDDADTGALLLADAIDELRRIRKSLGG